MSEADAPRPEEDSVPRPWTRWLGPALIVSLALNLLVAGMLVADYFRPEPRERMSTSSLSQILPRSFFKELPDARRQQFRDIFGRHRANYREDRRALRDAALAVADALAREPFDQAAVKAAIDAYATRSRELLDLGMTVADEVMAGFTPEERRALAERIRARSTPVRGKKED